jgi:hypothetical protein
MIKHYEINYENTLYKTVTNSSDNAYNIFKNYFPDSNDSYLQINHVNKKYFDNLDALELKEDEIN